MKLAGLALRLALTLALAPICGCRPPSAAELKAVHGSGNIAYIRVPVSRLTPEFLASTGFNRDHRYDRTYAFGYLTRGALASLPSAIFDDVVELDAGAWSHEDFDAATLEVRPHERRAAGTYEDFHDYAALTTELQKINTSYPAITTLVSAGQSVQGRELWLLKISADAAVDDDKPKLLYIANMHGDETVGRELLIYLARQLTSGYGTDPRMTALVNGAQIYLMPSMNPDGYELNQRYNANDVDLNRDFPDLTTSPSDTAAGRAPETAAVMALHQANHFIMSLNFHGGEVCFNVPWDSKANTSSATRFGDDGLMEQEGRMYADLNPTMHSNNDGNFVNGLTYGFEWYLVNGGMQDWSVIYRNSIHATVELTYTKWPTADNLPTRWSENQEGLLRYLEQGMSGGHFKVVDANGALVSGVTVRVSSADRDVVYPAGYVHRPTLAGAQTAQISAAGYQPATVSFTPSAFDGKTYQTVVLNK